jgi:hypothetical protein
MAWSQTDVDALKAAIATGVTSVMYSDGSQIQYRSLENMRSILAEMESEVAGPSVKRARTIRVNSCKGF